MIIMFKLVDLKSMSLLSISVSSSCSKEKKQILKLKVLEENLRIRFSFY